ncbi:hypothetical protein [Streptomyces tsukubensis]|uniref:hypothetical protein n=1 Tax=Streptomyces tsukubensis TaxID=83656 RepID=UPI003450512A
MRDLTVRALAWALRLLLPARGRHRTSGPVAPPAPTPTPVSPWARPWTGPSADTARAIFTAYEVHALTPEQRERFYATAWAEIGWDYPYTAENVHQVRTGVAV